MVSQKHLEIPKERLLQAWTQRHRHLSTIQEHVRQAAFGLIRDGRVATHQLLSHHLGLPVSTVQQTVTTLEDEGLILVSEPSGVVGIYGLSLVPTPHRLCLDGQVLFTWCALDAVGIPAGLSADAAVTAPCAQCRQELTLSFETGDVTHASKKTLCLWVVEPGQGRSAVGDT